MNARSHSVMTAKSNFLGDCLPATAASVISFAAAGLLGGCGSSTNPNRPAVHPVVGVVTYQQQPVEGATVLFHAQGDTPAATAVTDARGRYRLRTFDPADGAVAGSYKVTISKYQLADEQQFEDDNALELAEDGREPEPPKALLPQQYETADRTDLIAEVVQGKNELNFDLTD